MGVMDKLMFWKKEDSMADFKGGDFGGSDPFADMGGDPFASVDNDPLGQDSFGGPSRPFGAQPQGFQGAGQTTLGPEPDMQHGLSGGQTSQSYGAAYQQPFSQTTPGSFMPPPVNHTQTQARDYPQSDRDFIITKNIELLSSKLDAMRSSLEIINQRLESIERLARGEENKRNW